MNFDLIRITIFFLAGAFLAFLAFTIMRDNFRNKLNRAVGGMILFAGLGSFSIALGAGLGPGHIAPDGLGEANIYKLHYLWEFFFPLLLTFAWIYPVDRTSQFRFQRTRSLIFLPPLLHLMVTLLFRKIITALSAIRVYPDQSDWQAMLMGPVATLAEWSRLVFGLILRYHDVIFATINLTFVFSAIYYLELGLRDLTNERLEKQARSVIWGLRVSLGLFVVYILGEYILRWRLPDLVQPGILLAALAVGATSISFATVRRQFLDVRLAFRQSFVHAVASALLVGAYMILGARSQELLVPLFGDQAEIMSYVFLVFALLLFQPVSGWIDNVVRAMFMRSRSDHRNVIERFSRQVVSILDPVQLRTIIEDTFKTSLLIERVHFVMFDDSVGEYAVLPSEEYPSRAILDREDLMLRGINLLDAPEYLQTLEEFDHDSKLALILRERMTRLILPLKDAQHMLGFIALSDKAAGYRYSSEDLSLLRTLSNLMVTALTNARLYVESIERLRLQEEVTMARQIQLDLLPSAPPAISSGKFSVYSNPSRTVGGDFYDFLELGDGRFGLVIADASGKGMPAAMMIAQIQAILRSEVANGNPITTVLANMNRQVVTSTSPEKYVTLFYGEMNANTGEFAYANAGHNYPVLVRADGCTEFLKTGGPIIGALPSLKYESATVKLEPDDVLFLFTDGLSEAMNQTEEEYGEERIMNMIHENRNKEAQTIVDCILQDVRRHDPSDPPRDDTTIVALKMNGG